MMMKMRIVRVDPYGFCGREHHPVASDIGQVVVPIKMTVEYYDASGGGCQLQGWDADDAEALACSPELLFAEPRDDAREYVMACYTCVTRNGRLLDLMDFEVEVVR